MNLTQKGAFELSLKFANNESMNALDREALTEFLASAFSAENIDGIRFEEIDDETLVVAFTLEAECEIYGGGPNEDYACVDLPLDIDEVISRVKRSTEELGARVDVEEYDSVLDGEEELISRYIEDERAAYETYCDLRRDEMRDALCLEA